MVSYIPWNALLDRAWARQALRKTCLRKEAVALRGVQKRVKVPGARRPPCPSPPAPLRSVATLARAT